jgi:hypothetical protein
MGVEEGRRRAAHSGFPMGAPRRRGRHRRVFGVPWPLSGGVDAYLWSLEPRAVVGAGSEGRAGAKL